MGITWSLFGTCRQFFLMRYESVCRVCHTHAHTSRRQEGKILEMGWSGRCVPLSFTAAVDFIFYFSSRHNSHRRRRSAPAPSIYRANVPNQGCHHVLEAGLCLYDTPRWAFLLFQFFFFVSFSRLFHRKISHIYHDSAPCTIIYHYCHFPRQMCAMYPITHFSCCSSFDFLESLRLLLATQVQDLALPGLRGACIYAGRDAPCMRRE